MIRLLLAFLVFVGAQHVSATTIAFDGHTLACDRQVTAGGTKFLDGVKVERIGGDLVGTAGATDNAELFKLWYRAGKDPDKWPKIDDNFTALVITPEGAFRYWDKPVGVPVSAPHAIGSGARVALGAMKAGADATRAVKIATEVDLYTGGEVVSYTLDRR